jgi:hypothetical protein
MIAQSQISKLSNRLLRELGGRRIPESVLERDYCIAWFLVGLSKVPGGDYGGDPIPEFTDYRPLIPGAPLAKEAAQIPKSALVSTTDFVDHYTANHSGLLYHGTKGLDATYAILRQGLIISRPDSQTRNAQGRALYGRGAYSSQYRDVAQGNQSGTGSVIDLTIRDDLPLVIVDWDRSGGRYHCHLNYSFVVVWEVVDEKIRILEVTYVGSREDAPY